MVESKGREGVVVPTRTPALTGPPQPSSSQASVQPLQLHIRWVAGRRLGKRDIFGVCSPYATIRLLSTRGDLLEEMQLEKRKKNRNPEWRVNWVLPITGDEQIQIVVQDENRIRRDVDLGTAVVAVNTLSARSGSGQGSIDLPLLHRGTLVLHATVSNVMSSSPATTEVDSTGSDVSARDVPRDPLPNGWEEREDTNGRTFYVDHVTQRTQWERPANEGPNERERADMSRRENQQMRRMYEERAREAEETMTSAPRGVNEEVDAIDSGLRAAFHGDAAPAEEEEDDPLPERWGMQVAPNGRTFFIDHSNRKTTWDDPRLLTTRTAQRPLPAGWEQRLSTDGKVFFVDHNTKKTTWEDPRFTADPASMPYSSDFKRKVELFRSKLPKANHTPKCELSVGREHIFEDSFNQIMSKEPEALRGKLWIELQGERALDYGGVSREWCFLLSRKMFNPYYGLFEYSAMDQYTLQVNQYSGTANPHHIKYFQFIGRVIGMALYHGKLLDAFFIRPFYKQILGQKVTLEDMEAVDEAFFNSLNYIRENDPADLELFFAADDDCFGEMQSVELKEGGREIPVTNANKAEYIDLVLEWRFGKRIAKQMDALLFGLFEVVPSHLLRVFDAAQLELLMCGLQAIDVADWRANTMYKSGYSPNHVVIHHFWQCVLSFSNETRARLVQFVTGTSRVPMNGFRELFGSTGPQLFTIELWGAEDQLPRAHTCFNRLDLPPYSSYAQLKKKLMLAIDNSECFAGVD